MLQHLTIKDFAIVAKASIDFNAGMTVITGETGAGKSILLDAISLALGGRAESQWIRPGAESAEVTAIFDISCVPGAVLWLADLALTNEDDLKQCIIRRIIHPQGRSRAMINGRPVTSAQLRLLGEYLVQIHGQHQHQSLLKSNEQLRLLDAFGQHETLCHQVSSTFHQWETLYAQQQALISQAQHAQAQHDLLEYQIAELETIASDLPLLASLYQEHDRLTHAQDDLSHIDQALDRLANEETGNIHQWLNQIQQLLRPIAQRDPTLSNTIDCLLQAEIQLKEAHVDLTHIAQSIEMDPERLHHIERRLEKIHDLARKHKIEPMHLEAHFTELVAKRDSYAHHEVRLAQLSDDMAQAKAQYLHYAAQLTSAREKARLQLADEVTQAIQQLAMPGALFAVTLLPHEDDAPRASGHETVRFEVSANMGHAPQPLTKVASGGELSRISLAIELILAKYLATPCLIFDEVDVGISGKIGAVVGKALHQLGQSTQVLCITHLPQVAALGDHHLQVSKSRCGDQTLTEIVALVGDARINEIAQMLGGIELTNQAKANAQALMEV